MRRGRYVKGKRVGKGNIINEVSAYVAAPPPELCREADCLLQSFSILQALSCLFCGRYWLSVRR
jgi:hypothetical protein